MTQKNGNTIDSYLDSIDETQKTYFNRLRTAITSKLDSAFEECMNCGMLGYVLPKTIYPEGYHCDPKLPLPFAGLAAQKNSINLYHMGIYADDNLLKWFQEEYTKQCKYKLDMGKSCIRFKKYDDIPYALIEELFAKMSANDWIKLYETKLKK